MHKVRICLPLGLLAAILLMHWTMDRARLERAGETKATSKYLDDVGEHIDDGAGHYFRSMHLSVLEAIHVRLFVEFLHIL